MPPRTASAYSSMQCRFSLPLSNNTSLLTERHHFGYPSYDAMCVDLTYCVKCTKLSTWLLALRSAERTKISLLLSSCGLQKRRLVALHEGTGPAAKAILGITPRTRS